VLLAPLSEAVEGLDAPETPACDPPAVAALPPLSPPPPPHAASVKTTAKLSNIESRPGEADRCDLKMRAMESVEKFPVMAASEF
jgi:hypothetical protein